MAFDIAKFSGDGLDLLGRLCSTKALRLKYVLVDEDEHTAADIEQNISWWTSQTSSTMAKVNAEYTSAGVIESSEARIIVDLTLKPGQTSDVTIKTIVCVATGVESGIEEPSIIFCGVTDPAGVIVPYRTPDAADDLPSISASVSFYFQFNSASTITFDTVADPNYVVHSELERLVSCHSIGDTTNGDDQVIRGWKTFSDSITSYATTYLGYISNHGDDPEGIRVEISNIDTNNLQFCITDGDLGRDYFYTYRDSNDENHVNVENYFHVYNSSWNTEIILGNTEDNDGQRITFAGDDLDNDISLETGVNGTTQYLSVKSDNARIIDFMPIEDGTKVIVGDVLDVAGDANFQSNVDINDNLTVVNGNASFVTATTSGSATVGGNLTVDGYITGKPHYNSASSANPLIPIGGLAMVCFTHMVDVGASWDPITGQIVDPVGPTNKLAKYGGWIYSSGSLGTTWNWQYGNLANREYVEFKLYSSATFTDVSSRAEIRCSDYPSDATFVILSPTQVNGVDPESNYTAPILVQRVR